MYNSTYFIVNVSFLINVRGTDFNTCATPPSVSTIQSNTTNSMCIISRLENSVSGLRGGGGGGGGGTLIFGKTRFGDRIYQKAPPIGGIFGEVST